jgi:hypothetical protein
MRLSSALPFLWPTSTPGFQRRNLVFSRATPNLATVIPAMDHIDETLTTDSLNNKFEPSIRAALGLAKKTINRYYNKTDHSEVYRIAMGMSSSCDSTEASALS